jgi:hypothetical protein
MASNRNQIPDTSAEPTSAELNEQDNTVQELEQQASAKPPSDEVTTTTSPWIKNK